MDPIDLLPDDSVITQKKHHEEDVLVSIELAALHQLSVCGIELIRMGVFQFVLRRYLPTNTIGAYLVVNGHFQPLTTNCRMMRMNYAQSVSYLIEDMTVGDRMLCLTFPHDIGNGDLSNFEGYAKMQVKQFLTGDCSNEMQRKLYMMMPKAETEPIYNFSKLERVINKGTVATVKQINRLSGYIKEKIGKKEEPVGQQPLEHAADESWFTRLKNKTVRAYEATSKVFSKVADPVIEGGRKLNTKLCEKIDRSDNRVLKGIKDFTVASNQSIKNAFYAIKSPNTQRLEPNRSSTVPEPSSEPVTMHIEQTSPLTEIEGREDLRPKVDPVYNYRTLDEQP